MKQKEIMGLGPTPIFASNMAPTFANLALVK